MPKLGNCLEMYTCAQAVPKHVYSVQAVSMLCTNLALAWARVHFQAVSKLGHSNFYSNVGVEVFQIFPGFICSKAYISKCIVEVIV